MSYQRRKVRVGRVIGDKMDKMCIVEVEWRSFHRRYKKSIRRRSRFKAHDENNTAQLGDTVTIIESRPTSKTKRWRLVNVIDRQEIAELPPMDIAPAEEMEASMPEPVVEETVSQEEDAPVPVEAVDEAVAEAPEEPVDADVDEGDADAEPSDEAGTSDEAMDVSSESADGEEVPADEPPEPQDEVEAIVESVEEEEAPSQEESDPEEESTEMPESDEEVEAPSAESEPVEEKADEEKPRQ